MDRPKGTSKNWIPFRLEEPLFTQLLCPPLTTPALFNVLYTDMMYCCTRRFNKARQPIATEVDNQGDAFLYDTSHSVDTIAGKIIRTLVCTFEAMSGNDESVSSFGDLMMVNADGTLPRLNNIWECSQINMSLREEANGSVSNGWTCGYCPMPA